MAAGEVKIAIKTTNDSSGIRQAEKDAQSFGNAISAASAIGTAGLLGLGALAIKTAADFEQSMDQVGAVSGATAADMAKLSAAAKQIGADTSFSASQAANAMQELAAGGRSVAQIYGGEARAAVDLAAAGNYGLAASGKTIATVMDVWKNTQISTNDVVNRLAGAANASRFGVEDMSAAVAQAGGVAATMKVSFEDFTTAIAMTASSFASGSDAGTSYKTFLLGLDGSTDKAKDKIEELGLQFRDQAGHIKSTADLAQELADKVGILGEAEQTAALKTIFGNDAYRTAAAMMDGAAESAQKVNDVLANTDAATIAAQRMGNAKGSFEEFKGSAETLAISLGEKALPALTGMAEGATTAVNAFASLPGSTQALALGFTAMAVAAPAAVAGVEKIVEAGKAMKALATGGSSLAAVGPALSGVALGLGAVAIGADALLQKTRGYGLMDLFFGNPTAIQNASKFNAELARTVEIAKASGVDIDEVAAAWLQFDKAQKAWAEGRKSQQAADELSGKLHGLIDAYERTGASVWDLKAAYDNMDGEGTKAIFARETDLVAKLDFAYQNFNTSLAATTAIGSGLADSAWGAPFDGVATQAPKATSALDIFKASVDETKSFMDQLNDQIDEMAGRFGGLNPQMAANNLLLAGAKEELDDLVASGSDYSENLGMTKGQIEAWIKTLDGSNAAMASNEEAYSATLKSMAAYSETAGLIPGAVVNIDDAIRASIPGFEGQAEAARQAGAVYLELANNDAPAAAAALMNLAAVSPEAASAIVAGIADPVKKEALAQALLEYGTKGEAVLREGLANAAVGGVEALSSGLSTGIAASQADFQAAMYALGMAGGVGLTYGLAASEADVRAASAELGRAAVAAAAGPDGIHAQSPSKKFWQLGKWSAEGYVLGVKEGEPQIRQATAQAMSAGIDSAEATVSGGGMGVSAIGGGGGNVQYEDGSWGPPRPAWGVTPGVPPVNPPGQVLGGVGSGSAGRPGMVFDPGAKAAGGQPVSTAGQGSRIPWDGTGTEPSVPWVGIGAIMGQTGAGKPGPVNWQAVPGVPGQYWVQDPKTGAWTQAFDTLVVTNADGSQVWQNPFDGSFRVAQMPFGGIYQKGDGTWWDIYTDTQVGGGSMDWASNEWHERAKASQAHAEGTGINLANQRNPGPMNVQGTYDHWTNYFASRGIDPNSKTFPGQPWMRGPMDWTQNANQSMAMRMPNKTQDPGTTRMDFSYDSHYGFVPWEELTPEYIALRNLDPGAAYGGSGWFQRQSWEAYTRGVISKEDLQLKPGLSPADREQALAWSGASAANTRRNPGSRSGSGSGSGSTGTRAGSVSAGGGGGGMLVGAGSRGSGGGGFSGGNGGGVTNIFNITVNALDASGFEAVMPRFMEEARRYERRGLN